MDVRIGVIYTAKEIEIDMGEDVDSSAVQKDIDAALSKSGSILWLTDRKGRRFGVPVDKLAYVEVGDTVSNHRIGFVG